ncbi:MAG: hypothetical protein HC884_06470 [Chloroflexaceae bacterium]|nr:hypothetical protein [Chloroflexaceae bacterium]
MRRFHSYGPIDLDLHFGVERKPLVDRCLDYLIGQPDRGGHYFTIWAARQTGKTWLMRRVLQEIPRRYGEQFALLNLSFGWLSGMPFNPPPGIERTFFPEEFGTLLQREFPQHPEVTRWSDFPALFSRQTQLFDRPLILLIDEVDTLPAPLLDLVVRQFRELYLARENNWLHGLALIGVRAVLGIESQRGSPFNIQRSLHVPNLTAEEVREMYHQYQAESGQPIDPAVVAKVYDVTRGQPGLVSWFGELLTDTYNPTSPYPSLQGQAHQTDFQPIDMTTWQRVWHKSRSVEPNNTITNLIAKARMPEYQPFLTELFSETTIPFSFYDPIISYLYTHGIIGTETIKQPNGELVDVCRFTSPFVQDCLYQALSQELVNDPQIVLVLDPLDELTDVLAGPTLNLPAMLERYRDYLGRLKASGFNPWKEQPRRQTDYHLTEAVGHFHLFAWLQIALGRQCVVSPEFPTGNGKVDLHIRCGDKRGIIEVKSFVSASETREARKQAAAYAHQIGFDQVTVALFVPVLEETVLARLSGTEVINGVQVSTVAIGWV